MVKLGFSKGTGNNLNNSVSSKTSKKELVLPPEQNDSLLFKTGINNYEFQELIQDNEVISDKLVPTKCNEIVGFEKFEYYFKNWYSESLNNLNKSFLMVIGPTGCGKSTFIDLFCKEHSINVYTVKQNEFIKTKVQLLSDIINFIQSVKFHCVKQFDKLILIDEYSNGTNDIFSISDIQNLSNLRKCSKLTQTAKTEIIKFFNGTNLSKENIFKLRLPPVVIISADSKGSKISELKKTLDVYYIQEIPTGIVLDFTKTVAAHFGFKNELLVTKITNICKSDKRLIINTLSYLSKESDPGPGPDKIELFIESFYKDEDINIYDFVTRLFDNIEPIDLLDIYKTYHNDGYIISNLVHENYLDYSDDINSLASAIDSISYADTINLYEQSMLINPEIHCIYSLHIPSYYARSDIKNSNGTKGITRTSMINNKYNTYLNNKKTIDKINNNLIDLLSLDEIYCFKKFVNDTVKIKDFSDNQNSFIMSILSRLTNESREEGVDKLEMIYKYLGDFKINQEPSTKQKTLSSKFKQKLMLIK